MGLWNAIRNLSQKTAKPNNQQDISFTESKEEITLENIKQQFANVDDFVIKEKQWGNEKCFLLCIRSLVETITLQEVVINPLHSQVGGNPEEIFPVSETLKQDQLRELVMDICSGCTILLFIERKLILKINTFSPPQRSISPSESESSVLGPQDSFTESIQTNLSLIKRRLRTPNLKSTTLILGTEARQTVSVMYMENIANQENLDRVLYRLRNIEFHGFTGLPVLMQALDDKPYSPFPQFGITSRPDNAMASLLDGRIIFLMDGSPDVAIAPATFFELFASPEDFYNRWSTASLLRTIRFVGFFLTILFTPTYVSVLTFHQEMLPPAMLTLLAESRSRVPFPPIIEALMMEITIDILREAGSRMPTKIGQTIGIVGGIVIGTAAVEAGLASNILIVIVAISALLSFLPANYLMSNASRVVRYIFILAAGIIGVYGQMLAFAWLMIHLLNVTSLGTPYMTPVIPRSITDLGNSLFRAPLVYFFKRMGAGRVKKHFVRPTDEE
ncbi:spore germination protein [Ammoniphilus sp. 3BR4]|uniref:spore germination protein n=1 Tax=Ammoniphilus sp. 3BR4 TaxID=3158265 RepID=UPI003467438D